MEFKITHETTVEAESKEEALQSYVERWNDHWYTTLDLDIEQVE